jgi:hypothetical protein
MRSRSDGTANPIAVAAPAADSLHEQHQPLRKRLRQSAESVQQAQAEQVKLNATLTLRREQYKDKTSTIST